MPDALVDLATTCPTCGIPWPEHLVWNGRETRLWSVNHPLHHPGTPACQLRNGHLRNIERMLERWGDHEVLAAVRAEIDRRNRTGWWDGKPVPREVANA